MESCLEVSGPSILATNNFNSLNCILFALELLIIQPDISYTPDCSQNQELLEIYQRDLDLFGRLIHEHTPQFNTPDWSFGKTFASMAPNFLRYST